MRFKSFYLYLAGYEFQADQKNARFGVMKDPRFEGLSSLVVVDVLAALPMAHVMRLALLGHERLRQTARLKWVTDRMTDVTFGALLRARQKAPEFYLKSIIKRLNGKVDIKLPKFKNLVYLDKCLEIVEQLSGGLYIHIDFTQWKWQKEQMGIDKLKIALKKLSNVIYVRHTSINYFDIRLISVSSNWVFELTIVPIDKRCWVNYRPALLNGRDLADVLRAVCDPAHVSETMLRRRTWPGPAYSRGVWSCVMDG